MVSEASIQNYILKKLKEIPDSEWIKPTTTNKAGTQDIIGHIRGYYIAIEVKRNDKEVKNVAVPSVLQRYRIKETNRKGGFSFWTNNWKDTLVRLQCFAESRGFCLCHEDGRDNSKKEKGTTQDHWLLL